MDKKDIDRINELAKKKREVGLSNLELAEQEVLRKQYLKEFRENMKAVLDGIKIQEPDGSIHPLNKKK